MSPRRRTVVTVLVLLAIVAAAAIVGVWRVLGDAPEEVSLAEAVEVAEQAQEDAAAELDGTWAVDAESGEFTLDDATGSFAGFRVDEELARIGAFTAVGRTGDVSGTLVIAEESVTSVEIEVDLTTLRTDDSRRDGAVQRALGTSQHPTATFSLTEELHIDGAVELGGSISLMASGDLTVNGITQPVTID
ncbi:MAG: YceI family protein, partial [Acidimicrobiales bacterium]|nr:YceI family protein [Acidimicrobiales bacterium]